jgi:outer membrane protein OmpA-like peptidoglycan-associated protein
MVCVRDCGFAEAPARIVCDTATPAEVIRDFEFREHGAPAAEKAKIERLAAGILAGRVAKLRLIGHTDVVGNDAYNLRLGLDRAHAVLQALRRIVRHMPLDFTLESRGEACPIAPGSSEAARRRNRRVDVFVTPAPPKPRPVEVPRPGRPALNEFVISEGGPICTCV